MERLTFGLLFVGKSREKKCCMQNFLGDFFVEFLKCSKKVGISKTSCIFRNDWMCDSTCLLWIIRKSCGGEL